MTVLNFPASPGLNATYTENNVTYTWNGSYWDANNTGSLDNIYVEVSGDVMTGNLQLPGGGGNTAALQKQEITDLPVSTFDNDSGYITSSDIPPGTVSYWNKDGTDLKPVTDTDNVNIGDGKILLNADGSINVTGNATIGEYGTEAADVGAFFNGRPNSYEQLTLKHSSGTSDANIVFSSYRGERAPANKRISMAADGSSEFAGNMAIGTTGSYTPSTPAISLNAADGSIIAAGGDIKLRNDASSVFERTFSVSREVKTTLSAGFSDNTTGLAITDNPSTNTDAANIKLLSDGNIVAVGDIQSTSQNGGQLAGFRNQLINSDFRVWTRANESLSAGYIADRWYASASTTSLTVDVAWSSSKTLSFTQGSILLRNNSGSIRQGVELQLNRQGDAKNGQFAVTSEWTLSLYSTVDMTSNSANISFASKVGDNTGRLEAATTGNWELIPGSNDGEFNRYSITFTITATVRDTDRALEVQLPSAESLGSDVYYAAVQLEPGPVSTPFEHRPIGTELALCQRYFQKLKLQGAVVCMGNDSDRTARTPQLLTVKMRATPTVQNLVKDTSAEAVEQNGTAYTKSAPSAVYSSADNCIEITNVTKAGQLATVRYTAASVELEAEL